ncbi:O-acetyl-ADP-ribose deacetylase macrod1 [Gryganskiella cystojenkinii]|nr:O-acetyl-ADP-ribose deacetylase macrod1 [Gryganskiella cystojenkinii]
MTWSRKKEIVTLADIPALNDSDDFQASSQDPKYGVNDLWRGRISLWRGDITTLKIDAIVNAANTSLLGGGGIDGAIHGAAGPKLLQECRTLKGCETGHSKITKAYDLPSKHVIHTVGPIGEKPADLKNCYDSVLELVRLHKLKSVAFCCVSTGIYGYDNTRAAHVALGTVREWLDNNEQDAMKIERIIFCVFLPKDDLIYKQLIPQYFPESNIIRRTDKKVSSKPATRTTTTTMPQQEAGKVKGLKDSGGRKSEATKQTTLFDALKKTSESVSSSPSSLSPRTSSRDVSSEKKTSNDGTSETASESTLSSPDQLVQVLHRTASEQNLEKRKARDADLDEVTPSKRDSRRNSFADNDSDSGSWAALDPKGSSPNSGGKNPLKNGK